MARFRYEVQTQSAETTTVLHCGDIPDEEKDILDAGMWLAEEFAEHIDEDVVLMFKIEKLVDKENKTPDEQS